ncbi:transcription factor DIVARICATA-like [Olea europaea subsp. europaea]|uniref:Transcription factor DIVARICATA-like n=1 Tax=Olea europaea subsp. europaea TaxID=158383 RepID=A0A8S0UF51_OLEEU|nr:transcription factor DIVARICATA-like [Olea europaea subsp. europaea]
MEQRRREIFSKCHCNALDRGLHRDKWDKISSMVLSKCIEELKHHYQLLVEDVNTIEAGHVPLLDYIVERTSSSTKDRHQGLRHDSTMVKRVKEDPGQTKSAAKGSRGQKKSIGYFCLAWTSLERR